jgi:Sigma-70 region 2
MLIPSWLRLPLRSSWLRRADAAIAWGRFYAARHGLDPSFDSDSAFDLETEDGNDASGWNYAQPDSAQTTLDEFEGFFRMRETRLSAYLWRMTSDRQSASDLCQETFLRAWLFRVATNLALQLTRRKKAPVGAAGPLDDAFQA